MLDRLVKKQTVKDRLLAEAEIFFAAKGFYGTNIREITRAAGCNASAVNYYFGSKETLFLEVFKKLWRKTMTKVRKTLDETFPKGNCGPVGPSTTAADILQVATAIFDRKTADGDMGAFLCELMLIDRKMTSNCLGLQARRVLRSLVIDSKDVLRPLMPVGYNESILMQTVLNILGRMLFSRFVDMLAIQLSNLEGIVGNYPD